MKALFVLAALLGPAPAGADERAPRVFPELASMGADALDARHREVAARFAACVKGLEKAHAEYEAAPTRENLGRWGLRFQPCWDDQAEMEAVFKTHKGLMNRSDSMVATRVINRLSRKEPNAPGRTPFFDILAQSELMVMRRDKVNLAFSREVTAISGIQGQIAQDAEAWRRYRTAAAGGLGLLAFVGGVGYLWLREDAKSRLVQVRTAPAGAVLLGGNYRVGALVGRGAMGEVFEGVDVTLNRRVALKRLRPELAQSPADLEPLLAEARLVAALQHPNIVAIHAVERHGPEVYLVLEFVDGETLDARLARDGRLPWPEALALLRGCCAALGYAHARRVVHRDVKPANIMITKGGAPKLADFGIAHVARGAAAKMTRAAAFGTPPYMAPEQELGTVHAGVDLFALSACLYEAVTGRQAFTGPNFLAQKQEGVYAPPRSLAPDLPAGSDAFFARAFAPEPARRFKDAVELAAAAGALS